METQLAERMHEAVADEPPLGFDPDELTDRAARRQRRRRAIAASIAVVVASLIALPGVIGGRTDTHHRPAAPPFTGKLANCPGHLAEVVPKLLATHLAGVRVDLSTTRCTLWDQEFLVASGTQKLWVYRNRDRQPADFFAGRTPYERKHETRMGGAAIRVYEAQPNDGTTIRAVVRVGDDGLVVWASIRGKGQLAVTEEQLTALVTDEDLRY
jgi:hypothetical protein